LLIAVVALAGVAIYQQEQLAATSRNLSAGTVSIGGMRYYYETVSMLDNGSRLFFHGVTFTILAWTSPTYSNPSNYTYAGSVRLSNGTLLNLTGKTVVVEMTGYIADPGVGVSITFPDRTQVIHPGFNLTAWHQNAYNSITTPVYVLTYTLFPVAPPWFTQHGGLSAGFFVNTTSLTFPLTFYVTLPT